jgi:NAD(P)-dependent dehydrogenase (short-subunit alcohol dehydrogenase family)
MSIPKSALKPEQSHVLITGGSSGIGWALAMLYLQRGYRVSLLARNPQRLQQAQADLALGSNQARENILILPVDVGDTTACHAAINNACEQFGTPQIAILSAGIAVPGYFSEIGNQVFEDTMRINYFGSLYCAQALVPHFRKVGTGTLVFISSGAALFGLFGYSAYSPSKFAVRGLAEVLRAELVLEGIQVSIAFPPDTDTPQYTIENSTKPAETRAITGSAGLWQAEAVAHIIAKGIDKGRFAIAIGLELRLLARLQSLLSPLLNWWFDRVAVKARR